MEVEKLEIQRLQLGETSSALIVRKLIELYISPSARFHFIYPPQDVGVLKEDDARGSEVYFAQSLSNRPAQITAERVVGAVTLHPLRGQSVKETPSVEIARLVVEPSLVGKGIGGKLLDHSLDIAFAGNAKSAFVGILGDAPGWEIARDLYLKRGFMPRPDHSRVINVRDLGRVQDLKRSPFPGARIMLDRENNPHYVSTNVPMYGMELLKETHLARRNTR